MLEYSERTHQLMQAKYQYELQDVAEAQPLPRDLRLRVHSEDRLQQPSGAHQYMPADIWMTDTTFRDGQQSVSPFKPEQIEHLFKLESRLGRSARL